MELNDAYQELQAAVDELDRSGALTVAAAVKNRILKRSTSKFEERAWGFRSFREFLTAAETAGVVALRPTPGGDDVIIRRAQVQGGRAVPRNLILRPDFWDAFIKWPDGNVRAYDKFSDKVLTIPENDFPSRLDDSRGQLVEIPSSPRSTTVEHMREFLKSLPLAQQTPLLQALADPNNPEHRFVEAMTAETRKAWRALLTLRVKADVEAWRIKNGLEIDLYRNRPIAATATPVRTGTSASSASENIYVYALRQRLVAAISCMPLSALLQISIPVEYLLSNKELEA